MVRKLDELGLVTHERYRGVRLTEPGTRLALEMIRHHRLLELYLAESLGVPWDRVHQEAEVLEHVLSEELEALIAAKLGHPTHDPHGDPIPDADLVHRRGADGVPVDARAGRARRRVVRICDAEPEMLRYLAAREIVPGTQPARGRQAAVRRPAVRRGRAARRTRSAASSRPSMRVARVNPPTLTEAARAATGAPVPRRPRRCESCALARPRPGRRRRCSARRSSPPSPTSTPATSPPTSPAAPSTATCCCGSSSPRT